MVRRRLNLACAFAVLCLVSAAGTASAQVQVKPWFMVIVDTSGSMDDTPDLGPNSCGHVNNDATRRIGHARCALNRLVNGTGDAVFGLMQFDQVDCDEYGTCDDTLDSGRLLVGLAEDNQDEILYYVDDSPAVACDANYGQELVAWGGTPLNGTLKLAKDYFEEGGQAPSPFDVSPFRTDTYAGCRPVSVIMLTDGGGEPYSSNLCGDTPSVTATALHSSTVPVPTSVDPSGYITWDIRTYVIGFGRSPGDSYIESYAQAGGTDAPGPYYGFYAENEEELSIAFSQIIADSQLIEVCNGLDDDCDGLTDEGNPGGGDACGPSTDVGECDYGVLFCDEDTDGSKVGCDPDPDMPGSCYECVGDPTGPVYPTTEICDNKDNDCDGLTDENATDDGALQQVCGSNLGECEEGIQLCSSGVWGSCVNEVAPAPEVCDTLDNDCDGLTDENEDDDGPLEQECGTDVGECVSGTEICNPNTGLYEGCDAIYGGAEICDNLDNDCDGLTDLFVDACTDTTDVGECDPGMRLCDEGDWGDCFAVVPPVPEQCNNLDDDCDGETDNFSRSCFAGAGICDPTETCTAGSWGVCSGMPGTTEVCDGDDNDCDGITDEITEDCGTDEGECVAGTRTCSAGEWGNCDDIGGSPEVCDNQDDDCDGLTDEGLSRNCGKNVGECSMGTETCSGGLWVGCDAVTETGEQCNNQDDDCDGLTDEGLTQDCGSDEGECVSGTETCSGGLWVGCDAVTETGEICDDKDNDCDGSTDEGLTRSCGKNVGECSTGTETCSGGDWINCDAVTETGEQCNNQDDDCDGLTDEGLTQDCGTDEGECESGTETCSAGLWVGCDAETETGELCDNRDNDCDGTTDEDLTRQCGTNVGECSVGTETCNGGSWEDCDAVTATGEQCNNQDDDCDGLTDEGLTQDCGTDEGECESGTETCSAGLWVGCDAETETGELCDNRDNDCDGTTDEDLTRQCGTNVGECSVGTETCNGGFWEDCDAVTGTGEQCDNQDDDCDGLTDEGLQRDCGTDEGECEVGSETCSSGVWLGCDAVTETGELCDNRDNDCDGTTDEDLTRQCGTNVGECSVGTETCNGGSWEDCDAVTGTGEQCDNQDDDCDGLTDEGLTQACGTDEGECSTGTEVCNFGSWVGCTADGGTDEQCDNKDNDCDGSTDEDLSRECGTNIGECSTGTENCEAGQWVDCNADTGTDELCNSRDDDCDGLTDEGNPEGGTPCGDTDVGECEFGSNRCVNGLLVCEGDIRAIPEKCNDKDDDCDGTTDEGNPGGGAQCGTSTGECEKGTSICCTQEAFDLGQCTLVGALQCQGGQGPISELCDGLDNDCDGEVDEGNPEGGAKCDQVCDEEEPPNCQNVLEGVVDRVDGCAVIDANHPDDPSYDLPCGQCRYGTVYCIDAELQCAGAVGPGDEICDGEDNDCDGQTDEVTDDDGNDITTMDTRLNKPCGDDEGECQAGTSVCLDGSIECQGETPGSQEVCDGLDNDCDGVTDEGIPLGGACGTDVGECRPGTWACCTPQLRSDGKCDVIGEAVCLGGVEPINEICDGLDNDCDGEVDEVEDIVRYDDRLGKPCGTDEGVCEMGTTECIDNDVLCVGEIPPGKERCDCLDNDCDGETDEDDDMCPPEAICIDCQCAYPCRAAEEFSQTCPTGKSSKQVPDLGCYCVAEMCTYDNCSTQVIERAGATVCAPDSSQVGHCVCKDNVCTFPCDGTVCSENTVCDPRDGLCKANTCLVFGCEQDERCNAVEGECESDPCATAGCAEGQVCRDGECFRSCAEVQCAEGQKCVQGECVTDRCAEVSCGRNQVCNPDDGECVDDGCAGLSCPTGFLCDPVAGQCEPDPCLITRCPQGQTCSAGECSLRCGGQEIECDNRCVDPLTDPSYCGASGDCEGANAGVRCPENQVCAEGACTEQCPPEKVNCNGACIDPKTNSDFCGAFGDCTGENAGERCADDEVCVGGVCSTSCPRGTVNCGGLCIDPQTDGAWCGASGDCQGANAGSQCADDEICESGVCFKQQVTEVEQEPKKGVVATGGGCSCTVPAGASSPDNGRGPWTVALLLLGLVALRLGRRFGIERSAASSATLRAALAASLLVLAITAGGCNAEPFCLNCEEKPDAGPVDASGGAAGGGSQQSEAGIRPTIDSSVPDVVDAGSGECLQMELCNGEDDDCDGETDEDFDLNSNVNHCGSCETSCVRDHAFSECDQGSCVMSGCDIAFVDLDEDEENGCEYYCLQEAEEDTVCDLRDNDCDGLIDDEVDLESDPMNCGSCGFVCKFAHAENGGQCVDGECVLDTSQCDEGYHDIDGNQANGCEYECTIADPDDEVCNLVDDDCDGLIDEEADADGNDNSITSRDERLAQVCGSAVGECETGITECRGGSVECIGGTGEETEVCDGVDNNCDGETDESDPDTNKACADPGNTGLGTCQYGTWQCNRTIGVLECVGQITPIDELCDGLDNDCDNAIDNGDPEGGEPCGWTSIGDCRTDSDNDGQTDDPCGTCVLGVRHCIGAELQCVGLGAPIDELCNLLDDDCDGETDEDNPEGGDACGSGIGACEPGSYECIGGDLVCTGGQDPVEEICNGIDDDCDRVRDEDLSRPCGPAEGDEGACAMGTEVCDVGNWVGCTGVWPENEVCDDQDNDCDGVTDEGLTRNCGTNLGECVSGIETCSGGVWGGCTAVTGSAEVCNDEDDDCDGITDEGLTRPCGTDTGECVAGTETCSRGAWVSCTAVGGTVETCDNQDDDCDGSTDEGIAARPCGTDLGECVSGQESCSGGIWGSCTAVGGTAETCDNQDDDCDGITDEGLERDCGTDEGECSAGTETCFQGSWQGCTAVTGTTETCNNEDDDCDGATDEGIAPRSCGTDLGECVSGEETCSDGFWGGCTAVTGTAETCDNEDDDCDGLTDEGIADRDCGTDEGECSMGTESCSFGQWLGCTAVTGSAESCDNKDNDCDGATDEGIAPRSCGTDLGECVSGEEMCDAGSWQGCTAVAGTAETCDNQDDDCDGLTDEGVADRACGTDEGECSTGTESCSYGQWLGCDAVTETGEICDDKDNDCDGSTDEGVPSRPCGKNVGDCSMGTESCSGGDWINCDAVTETAELCDNRDNDCDGLTDEGVADRDCGTDEGECVGGTESCSYGQWLGCDAVTETAELCDNKDNDCDGTTDEGILPRACGTDVGECVAGTEMCDAGSWVGCNDTPGTAETCDGEDDDCDGLTDEGNPDGGGDCGATDVGQCEYGVWTCVNGGLQCIGEVTDGIEVCDYVDNDCDGVSDDVEFNFAGNVYYCGDCSTNCWIECPFSVCHAYPSCDSGVCGIDYCVGGYVDKNNDPTDGCECKAGTEICNNLDDDCDGSTDEGITRPCGSIVGECTLGTETCSSGVWGSCSGGVTATTEACDYLDNDCDGITDEFFGVGTACSVGTGICLVGGGQIDCDTTDLDANSDTVTVCKDTLGGVLLVPGDPNDEQDYPCNALDDDCDGDVDEPCAPDNPQSGCVSDMWVPLPSGGHIFAYEASRPDADSDGAGVSGLRACSEPLRMPWTNVTHGRAAEACAAAGGRLCTEAEWEEACMFNNVTGDGDCGWSYAEHEQASLGYDCNDYDSNPETCNANDWDSDTDTAGDQDDVYPTGSFAYCHRQYESDGSGLQVYDLSGNVKEWTMERSSGVNPLRGGAMNNTKEGVSCGFDWTLADDDFLFFNAGFRCCYGCLDELVIRVTEYYLAPGEFGGEDYTLTLDQDLADNYFVIIQGSAGDGSDNNNRGPDENYARLVADPWATGGDLTASGATNQIGLHREGTADSWVGVVTVVESLSDHTAAGFQLLDVEAVSHAATTGSKTTTAWGSDIDQIMLMGGYNGAGCTTSATDPMDHNNCHARIYPTSTNTISWSRHDSGLESATSTVMVVQWGSEWTVQRARVTGNNGGDDANSTGEYDTGSLGQSVARANTWVWGTGFTDDDGIGDAGEGQIITLGDGVNQNATENEVAVGTEEADDRDFEVYALTHPDILVDYRFKTDGNNDDLTVDVSVDSASSCSARMALSYNSCNGTGSAYPRPIFSARYYDDDTVRLERRRWDQPFAAWVQGIQMCIYAEVCP